MTLLETAESTDPLARRLSLRQRREAHALAAIAHLRQADPRWGPLIDRIGPHRPIITRDPFVSLAGAIVHQQVSMHAAKTILSRLLDRCPDRRLTPAHVLALTPRRLRSAGLSRQKVRYLRDLSEHFEARRLTTRRLRTWNDDRVLTEVTQVLGIGRWTAEMLLIFSLERPDVWPIDDLGVQKAVARFIGRHSPPVRAKMERLADPWRPFRSYATWYLWRSLEGPLMPGIQVAPKAAVN